MEAIARKGSNSGVQRITLDVPKEKYDFVLSKGWKHKEVYLLGVQAKEEHPNLLKRIDELERAKVSHLNRIAGLWKDQQRHEGRIALLERKVAEIEALLPPRIRSKIKSEVISLD